jgi:hypothetical protein
MGSLHRRNVPARDLASSCSRVEVDQQDRWATRRERHALERALDDRRDSHHPHERAAHLGRGWPGVASCH